MNTIVNVANSIRKYVNEPVIRKSILNDRIKWKKACACLDVIDSTQVSIDSYFQFSKSTHDYSGDCNLMLYGLLQAYFVQQDAMDNLSNVLFNRSIDWKKDYYEMYLIRELRNDAIGHPTNRNNGKSFHYIKICSRHQFELFSENNSDDLYSVRIVNLIEVNANYEETALNVLNIVREALCDQLKNHRLKFVGDKLAHLVPDNLSYMISKIRLGIIKNAEIGGFYFKHLKDEYEKIKQGLTNRYITIDASPEVNEQVKKIDYIFSRMQGWMSECHIYKNPDADIFLDGLFDRLMEFKELLIQIDESFEVT
jgi:hypothetical protein